MDRRRRRKISKAFDLQLTSMMDMLIILIVFLLKSYSTNAIAFATSNNISLPVSTAEELPVDSINLVIDPSGVVLDGERILDFKLPPGVAKLEEVKSENATYELQPFLLGDRGRRIMPLYDALIKQREKAELLMSKAVWKDESGNVTPPKFQGIVVLHADKAVRYDTIRKVLYTAGAAQYKVFKLVTVKKDAG